MCTYTHEAGYMSVRLSEAIHLIKCVLTEVNIQLTKWWFYELPVMQKNQSMILTPHSHLLQPYSMEIDCDSLITAQRRIEGYW